MGVGAALYDFGDVMFFPSSPFTEPDHAINETLVALGWTCDEARGGTEAEATQRLRSLPLPAQLGPCNMGHLTYNPGHENMMNSDHYVTLLEVHDEYVRVHDPHGYPNATLPRAQWMQAWSAEGVNYGPNARPLAYVSRSNFRPVESLTFEGMLQRGLAKMRELMGCAAEGPNVFAGPAAFRAFADAVEAGHGPQMHGQLVWFALPLGARRSNDVAIFLRMVGEDAAATLTEEKSRLYGALVYPAVHHDWVSVARLLRELAETESALIATLVK